MLNPDPVLTSAVLVAIVQCVLTFAVIMGWVSLRTSVGADIVAMILALCLPILGALYARRILRRQQDDAEDAKRYDL
jgi:positive regulator of sigma E activity